MSDTANLNSSPNSKEIENVIHLIKNNVDCTKAIINHIDDFLETKQLPKSILDALITQRNACAVNIMNFTRVMHHI
ncbi:hypothetical protein [Aquimarina sp. 2201CG14-23]|uniref:hypothetical protein n=1 Tax=Aquimarina mycalae TaxID=3040073 RepID=UPI0024782665|nr:hypothetical protein [Aquimarina sp. 2201CG14-23]MDH7444446.1 hypothetical protein [Aquimarina sp. 2201CG14-23]